jgi:carbon starvation protein
MALMLVITVTALLWIGLYRAPLAFLGATDLASQISFAIQSIISLVLVGLAVSVAWMGYKNIRSVRDSYTGAVTSDD